MAATWTSLGVFSVRSVQALTESAPTLASEGVSLNAITSIVPVVRAPEGQTITSGTVLGYYRADYGEDWVRAPHADRDLTDVAGLASAALPAIPVISHHGRFALIANAVVLSGGAALTIDFECSGRNGGEPL